MPKVYIMNKSFHDYSDAKRFGELIYLTDGLVDRLNTGSLLDRIVEALYDSEVDDYILPCSLPIITSLACAVFAERHKYLNLLLFSSGKYIVRKHKIYS